MDHHALEDFMVKHKVVNLGQLVAFKNNTFNVMEDSIMSLHVLNHCVYYLKV